MSTTRIVGAAVLGMAIGLAASMAFSLVGALVLVGIFGVELAALKSSTSMPAGLTIVFVVRQVAGGFVAGFLVPGAEMRAGRWLGVLTFAFTAIVFIPFRMSAFPVSVSISYFVLAVPVAMLGAWLARAFRGATRTRDPAAEVDVEGANGRISDKKG